MNIFKQKRIIHGLSKQYVAEKIGVCVDMLDAIERDEITPEAEVCEKLFSLFEERDKNVYLIKHIVPIGEENAITRADLAKALGTSDRQARKMIETARASGVLIVTRKGGGYYQTEDIADIKRQYRQDTNRAMSILYRRKHMRDFLKMRGESV